MLPKILNPNSILYAIRHGAARIALQPNAPAGGGPVRVQGVRAVVDAGIAVMGHTGLMPQTISVMGGFRPQAQSAASALSVLRDAKVSV